MFPSDGNCPFLPMPEKVPLGPGLHCLDGSSSDCLFLSTGSVPGSLLVAPAGDSSSPHQPTPSEVPITPRFYREANRASEGSATSPCLILGGGGACTAVSGASVQLRCYRPTAASPGRATGAFAPASGLLPVFSSTATLCSPRPRGQAPDASSPCDVPLTEERAPGVTASDRSVCIRVCRALCSPPTVGSCRESQGRPGSSQHPLQGHSVMRQSQGPTLWTRRPGLGL